MRRFLLKWAHRNLSVILYTWGKVVLGRVLCRHQSPYCENTQLLREAVTDDDDDDDDDVDEGRRYESYTG